MGSSVLKDWLWNWKDQKKSVNCDLKAWTACQQLWIVVQHRQCVKQSVGARVRRETTHQLWQTGLIPCTNWTKDYPTKKPTVFPLISFDKAYSLCAQHGYNWATDAKKLIKKPHLDIMPDCWNILNPNIIFIDVPARQPPACVDFFLFQNSLQLVKKIWRISW